MDLIQLTVRKPVKQNTTQPPKVPASNKSNLSKVNHQAVPVALPAKDIQARKVLLQNNVARISAAEINLPGIEQGLSIQDIKIMSNQPISCPLKLKIRPCEQITLKAESSLREECKKQGKNIICTVSNATCKKEIDSEKYWFVNTVKKYPNLNNDAIRIQNVIWQNHRDHNVCKIGDMDVKIGHLLSL